MSVCDVCGGVTADHGRHLLWHRTMSNIPRAEDVPLADIRVAYPGHDFGPRPEPEPTPIYDALLRERLVDKLRDVRRDDDQIVGIPTLQEAMQPWVDNLREIGRRMLAQDIEAATDRLIARREGGEA